MVRLLFEMARFYAPSTIFIDEVDSLASQRGSTGEHEASRRVKSELLVQMDGVGGGGAEDGECKNVMVLAASNFPWDLDEARISAVPRLYLGCTSAASRLYLGCTSLVSRLYLGCTSVVSRLYLGCISARDLDEALRRRLEKRIYIPLPEPADIRTLLGINLKDVQLDASVCLDALAERLAGFSPADVTNLCREAAMMPMRRAIKGLRHDEIRRLKREDTDTPLCQDDIEQSLLRINKTVSESDLGRFEEWLKEFGST